jgi:hypothetical protein
MTMLKQEERQHDALPAVITFWKIRCKRNS